MYCIREVVLAIGDRILGVILILALITCTRNPDDSLEALGANQVNHRLEEIMQCFIRIRAIFQMNPHRLIGKFDGDDARILLDILIGSESFPDRLQIAIIFVANTDITRTDTRWTYDDVESMCYSILDERNVELLEIEAVARHVECRDICLVFCFLFRIIGPAWIHVQSEHGTISSLLLVGNSRELLREIIQARLNVGFRITSLPLLPSPPVEVAVWRIHYAMQDNSLTIGIHQVLTLHTECRQIIGSQSRH